MKTGLHVVGLDEARRVLDGFSSRRLSAAVATALTRTAVTVRDQLQSSLQSAFDRPTPYTVRQLRYVAATASKPVAVVGFNVAAIQDVFGNVERYQDLGPGATPAGKYLQFQIDGGQRRAKRFELALRQVGVLPAGWLAVPGQRAKLDQYGNHSVGELRQILSWFDAAELVAGSRQNMGPLGRAKRLRGTRKRHGFEYFVARPGDRRAFVRSSGGRGSHALQPGIYRRTHTSFGTRIEPIVIFVRAASYQKRWDFYGLAQRGAQAVLDGELHRAINESAARLAARRATP